jgi:hypothetical protein
MGIERLGNRLAIAAKDVDEVPYHLPEARPAIMEPGELGVTVEAS